jgi:lysozyme
MKISKVGLELIKSFEGCRLHAYHDVVNVLTIGYGSTGSHVKEGMTITQKEAEALLLKDLSRFEAGVDKAVTVELNQNQFDALVSFSFNLGLGNLGKSTLLKLVNQKRFHEAAGEFHKWNKAGGHVLTGLTRRREAERDLFLKVVPKAKPKSAPKHKTPSLSWNVLKQGSVGHDVKVAQKALGVNADGIFGSNTRKAVVAFQKAHHLTADGIVGKITWNALF